VSDSVFHQVQDKIHVRFDDMGQQKLKNIERPVQAYRVVSGRDASHAANESRKTAMRIARFSRVTGPASEEEASEVITRSQAPMIMILPFKNLSGDADQNALVDGFRLSIQSSLVKLSGLFLINAPASEHYRNTDVSPIQAGNEVGVRYVIDGAVQTAGDRIRVTIHLTDAPAAQIVWAESYDRVVDDIFEIQDDITTEVAIALDLKLLTGEGNLIWWKDLPDRKTRELALRGLSYLYLGSKDGNAVARSIYEELNQICPDAPQAAALIAFTHFLDVMRGFSEDTEKSIESATVYAQKAIELGDIDGFGHIVLGSVRLHQRRYEEALALAEKAVTVRISCPLARGVYSNVLHFYGQHEQAIKNMKTAIKAGRVYPPWMANVLSASYRDSGQIAPSICVANEALRLDPEDIDGLVLLCTGNVMSNSVEEACRVAQEILRVDPTFSVSAYAERQPYKDVRELDTLVTALKQAGLPD
jgi:TolB-like protein